MPTPMSMMTPTKPLPKYLHLSLHLPISRRKRTHIYIAFATLDDLLNCLSRLSLVAGQCGHALSYGIKEIQAPTGISNMVSVIITDTHMQSI